MSFVTSGKLRPIAVAADKRIRSLPDVPTLPELGYKDVTTYTIQGIVGPAGMPAAVTAQLNAAFNRAARDGKVQALLGDTGFEPIGGSPEEFRTLARFEKTGHFKGPVYHRADGRKQWGLNAVWEQVFGERLKYPMPRYDHVVVADPARFNWLPLRGAPGVQHKFMGAFSERAVRVEMLRIAAGTTWTSTDAEARRLFYVCQGEVTVNGSAVRQGAAIDIGIGEAAQFVAAGSVELFLIALPPIVLPQEGVDQSQFEVIDGLVDSE